MGVSSYTLGTIEETKVLAQKCCLNLDMHTKLVSLDVVVKFLCGSGVFFTFFPAKHDVKVSKTA